MNRIDAKFRELEKRGEKALIGFITAGYPSAGNTAEIAESLANGGVDIIEFGLPFSDPIADGPTIQKSSQKALEAGMNPDIYFETIGNINSRIDIPKICMTYYNLVLQRGVEKFAADCSNSGIDGIIVPDLPIEESEWLLKACENNGVYLIFLVAETTTEERLRKIASVSKGFIYVVSVLGTTGARKDVSRNVRPLLDRIRSTVKDSPPLAVGFGISKPEHVSEVLNSGANAVIVGSALINIIAANTNNKNIMLKELREFASRLKEATKK